MVTSSCCLQLSHHSPGAKKAPNGFRLRSKSWEERPRKASEAAARQAQFVDRTASCIDEAQFICLDFVFREGLTPVKVPTIDWCDIWANGDGQYRAMPDSSSEKFAKVGEPTTGRARQRRSPCLHRIACIGIFRFDSADAVADTLARPVLASRPNIGIAATRVTSLAPASGSVFALSPLLANVSLPLCRAAYAGQPVGNKPPDQLGLDFRARFLSRGSSHPRSESGDRQDDCRWRWQGAAGI